eukprot:IDg11192t1
MYLVPPVRPLASTAFYLDAVGTAGFGIAAVENGVAGATAFGAVARNVAIVGAPTEVSTWADGSRKRVGGSLRARAPKRRPRASVSLVQLQRLHTRELTDVTVEQLVVPHFESEVARNAHASPPSPDDDALPFYSASLPGVGIRDYFRRALKHAGCSRGSFVVAVVILKRAARANPLLALCARNVHRLFIVALLLAAKAMDDRVRMNGHYARVAGMPDKAELADLEWRLLQAIKFRVVVTREEYTQCVLRLAMHASPEDDENMDVRKAVDRFGGALATPLDCPPEGAVEEPCNFIVRASPGAIQESERRVAKRGEEKRKWISKKMRELSIGKDNEKKCLLSWKTTESLHVNFLISDIHEESSLPFCGPLQPETDFRHNAAFSHT